MKRTPFIFCSFDTDRSVKMQKYLPENIFLCDGLHPNLSFRVHWNEDGGGWRTCEGGQLLSGNSGTAVSGMVRSREVCKDRINPCRTSGIPDRGTYGPSND